MVKSLEEYVAQATNAYKPSTTAVQAQLDALSGQLETTNQAINKNYAQQQARLNQNQNQAAEAASLQAAGSGGSFGGAANLANRKYYEQSFVPAVTQMRTNQSNDLAAARQANENTRNSLNTQLANIQSQAANQGTNQYYNDTNAEVARQYQAEQARLEREYQAQQAELNRQFQAQQNEANRAIQRQQIAQSNAYNDYLLQAAKQAQKAYSLDTTKNLYGGYNWRDANGNLVRIGEVAANTPGDFNDNLYQRLYQAAVNGDGDYYSAQVYNEMSDGARFAINNTGRSTGNSMYDTLGIIRIK